MKIITWNCNMAFRKKAEIVRIYQPDILIVPECEHPDKLIFPEGIPQPTDSLWFGHNANKGLAIFSYNGFRLKTLDGHNPELKTIVPVEVKAGEFKFNLFAIWANNPGDRDGQYITQVWKALHYYQDAIREKETILIGDFNSNTIWDKPRREGNHSTVVEHLKAKGIFSVYHHYFNLNQGQEVHPTLYMYRHKDKPYHIDYCFASEDLVKHLTGVEIGDFDSWNKFSDHVPVIISFDKSIIERNV
jgi:exodeoxyribonuclease-3